jgi:hypothetical protein
MTSSCCRCVCAVRSALRTIMSSWSQPRILAPVLSLPCTRYGGRLEYIPAYQRRGWKGKPMPGSITRPPGPPDCGSLAWDSKLWSRDLRDLGPTRTALAKSRSSCTSKLQSRPLVNGREKKNWSRVQGGGLTPGQTSRLIVGGKITSVQYVNWGC